jgi:predicted metalloprotease with PDZ domain
VTGWYAEPIRTADRRFSLRKLGREARGSRLGRTHRVSCRRPYEGYLSVTRILASILFAAVARSSADGQVTLQYAVDLADTAHHVYSVTLRVPPLTPSNSIFEFAATAPGTYQTMDIGRFVQDFTALDSAGRPLPTERIGTNEWRLTSPRQVNRIAYHIRATRDTVFSENRIYPMCGTALEADYALINGQAVFGFPRGMQAVPLTIRLAYPAGWTLATALTDRRAGLMAATYDQLVDSPILLGAHLTRSQITVTGVPVTIVVRSAANRITAAQLREGMRGMLAAAGAFLRKLPVDHYTFLYDFGGRGRVTGAWEHSYSSEYTLPDSLYTSAYGASIRDAAAHEFFHIVTPLNIHSEIIEHFNFATPVPSQHLWLYEGTTEWAAHKMQLEAGLKSLPDYLATIVLKARIDRASFDTTWSLRKMSLTSYSDSGQRQYPNIYMRGALVAGLLDIELLQQSGGKAGLRELILDLSHRYGKRRAFPETGLIDTIIARTSPDVRDFFDRYIRGAERPPIKEFYGKLGITLVDDEKGLPARLEIDAAPTAEQLKLREAWMGPRARIS